MHEDIYDGSPARTSGRTWSDSAREVSMIILQGTVLILGISMFILGMLLLEE
jgi:hypothetical protein